MKNQLTIIKIGGSVLTYKNRVGRYKKRVAEQIAAELKSYLEKTKERLIIVHGAGSYGHILAKKYNLTDIGSTKENILGIGLTHVSVNYLNVLLSNVLLKKGIPVYPVSSGSILIQKGGNITFFNLNLLRDLLERNIIPILHGDVVVNKESRFSICSGDQIVSYLSNKLPVRRTFFLTDVDGVFTEDPKSFPNAKLIKLLKKAEINKVQRLMIDSEIDVTGLMEGKLQEVRRTKGPVLIFNGNKSGNLLKALRNGFPGTLIK